MASPSPARPDRRRSRSTEWWLAALTLHAYLDQAQGELLRAHPKDRRLRFLTARFTPEVLTFDDASRATKALIRALDRRLPNGLGPRCWVIAPIKDDAPSAWHAHLIVASGRIPLEILRGAQAGIPGIDQSPQGLFAQVCRRDDEFRVPDTGHVMSIDQLARIRLRREMRRITVSGFAYAAANFADAVTSDKIPPGRSPWGESRESPFYAGGSFPALRAALEREILDPDPDPDVALALALIDAPSFEVKRGAWHRGGEGRPPGQAHRIIERHRRINSSLSATLDPDLPTDAERMAEAFAEAAAAAADEAELAEARRFAEMLGQEPPAPPPLRGVGTPVRGRVRWTEAEIEEAAARRALRDVDLHALIAESA